MHVQLRCVINSSDAPDRFILKTEETGVCADPENAGPVFVDDADKSVCESFRWAEDREVSVLVADEPASLGAGPQDAVSRDEQRVDAFIAQRRHVLAIEDDEARTVETYEPGACSDPEIAVGSLRE